MTSRRSYVSFKESLREFRNQSSASIRDAVREATEEVVGDLRGRTASTFVVDDDGVHRLLEACIVDGIVTTDLHAARAAEMYGVPLSEVTPEQRRAAKVENYGRIYGIAGASPGHPTWVDDDRGRPA